MSVLTFAIDGLSKNYMVMLLIAQPGKWEGMSHVQI